CPCCGVAYPMHPEAGYLDLVPRTSLGEVTQYADHEFHERLHVTEAPPVLSARVKADMALRMLAPRPGEAGLDLGCGAGKLALYVGGSGAHTAGLDVAPFFLPRVAREVDLVLGDLRRLPFRKGAFPAAYSLDVLEHLDEPDVGCVLLEARRSLAPRGRLFVYTHAMESSRLALFQRGVNRLAKRLGRAGLIDHERDALPKSDHRNAIPSHEHFEALCAGAGLAVAERRALHRAVEAGGVGPAWRSGGTTTSSSRRWWRTWACGCSSSGGSGARPPRRRRQRRPLRARPPSTRRPRPPRPPSWPSPAA